MRSFAEWLSRVNDGVTLPQAALLLDAEENMTDVDAVRAALRSRLRVLEETVHAALSHEWQPKLIPDDKKRYAASPHVPLSGALVWRASQIAVALGTCNASMGRIVAAPTAGSCGILPGLLFAWNEYRDGGSDTLFDGFVVAAGVGDVIAHRATLAGAAGGCQAECGVAAAMGAAALAYMEGASPEACTHASALAIKSILGLVCDPVAGLVEVPCVKRNGSLVALGAIAADMALAGIRSVIPPDEVVDVMAEVGRALPETLRETARGGCATSPTGRTLARALEAARAGR